MLNTEVLCLLPSYLGARESLHLLSVARAAQACADSDPTVWNKLQITTNTCSVYTAGIGARDVIADCTLDRWNTLPVAFRKRVAANVSSLIVHVHSEEQLLNQWKIGDSGDFCNLIALSLVACGDTANGYSFSGETGFSLSTDPSTVAHHSSRLTAFLMTLPSSLRFLDINMRFFPSHLDVFLGAEHAIMPLFVDSGGRRLQGVSMHSAKQVFDLQPHHLSQCSVFSVLDTLDREDVIPVFRKVNMCSKLRCLNISLIGHSFGLLHDEDMMNAIEPPIQVLMLGVESFFAPGLKADDLAGFIPLSVQLLFLRLDSSAFGPWARPVIDAEDFLEQLARFFRTLQSHIGMWVFAFTHQYESTGAISWEIPAIDLFSPLLDKSRWKHPSELIDGMCLSGVKFVEI